jgi:ATP-dependent Lhr-like helicase
MVMEINEAVLSRFHPLVASWFAERIGAPTDLQKLAWPPIAAGEHVLITAPTGSGKTLAAFLWAINELVTGKWPLGRTGVLYVSPLKALNNDIRRNLLRPLAELETAFRLAGEAFPPLAVAVRSGDTPQSERRRMQRHPPEFLITTPESLNLLLSSHGGRSLLNSIRTVILDEIHAVVDGKRGVHLITAVERLVELSGEFQRIALSATVRPLDTVAQFVGGYRMEGDPRSPGYRARPVRIVSSSQRKQYRLSVRFPEAAAGWEGRDSFWQPFVDEIKEIVSRNRSTLIFANSRRLCEKLTHLLNEDEPAPVAYAHHGSLSREIRAAVESKLKAGELRAIVATNSLELGIDIGALDEVVLVQSPPSFSSAIQRIGRAGHRVGEVSRGTLFPVDPRDLVQTAVVAGGVDAQDIEAVRPVICPLDVLAQVIVSMTGIEARDVDALFARLKTAYSYHSLSRAQFDLVLSMLAGRYAGSRIRELKPRLAIDRIHNTVTARKGALQAVYFSGGTIPDRGYFHLRHQETGARIGELDEEFVWEASIGQVFTLSTQNWKIERITHNDVFVTPARPGAAAPPFWKAEENLRAFHLSERMGELLEAADEALDDPGFKALAAGAPSPDHGAEERFAALISAHCSRSAARSSESAADGSESAARHPLFAAQSLERGAVKQLIAFLGSQKEATGRPLPHRRHLLVEHVSVGPGGYPGSQTILHTVWGGRVNRPFAMALEAAWEARYGYRPEIYPGNDCILLQLPHEASGGEILSLVTSANVSGLLRKKLEGSGFFGARFRECAGRALLLPRRKMSERMPLWLSRLRSQKLLDSVLQYEDFPILLEAWRTCLKDELDLQALTGLLAELESGDIAWSEVHTGHPSPMARSITWPQINQYMYMDDRMRGATGSRLRTDLLHEVALTPELRPAVPVKLAEELELKRRRLSSGYSPDSALDLLEWVKERLLLPESEWESLLRAIRRDHGLGSEAVLAPIAARLARIHPAGASGPLIVALEMLSRVSLGFYGEIGAAAAVKLSSGEAVSPSEVVDPEYPELAGENPDELFTTLLSEWLQYYGPRTAEFVRTTLGLDGDRLAAAVEGLADAERLVVGRLLENSEEETLCDSENYEVLLRMLRAGARPVFTALDVERLQPFLAGWQGLGGPEARGDADELFRAIEQLACYPAPAALWETEIFPARFRSYDLAWLDSILRQSDLRWIGMANLRVAFCFESDLDLVQEEEGRLDRGPVRSGEARRMSHGRDVGEIGETGAKSRGHGDAGAGEPRLTRSMGEQGIVAAEEEEAGLGRLFLDPAARYDFSTLLRTSNLRPAELADKLWNGVWRGKLVNDTFAALRHGIENHFKVANPAEQSARGSRRRRHGSRVSFSMWKGSLPMAGNWARILWPERAEDAIEKAEREKDRARLLLDRYGILFRELLQNELPALSWGGVFRALRLMELSGEVLTGYFFHGIPGPQFVSHEAFRRLQRESPGLPEELEKSEEAVYWMCATDPASLCGVPLDGLKGKLPRRVASTHLVYHGGKLVMESRRGGKTLIFYVPEDDPHLQTYMGLLDHLLTRKFQPLRRIVIETINGADAAPSPYAAALRLRFDVSPDFKNLVLYRKHGDTRGA